MRKDEKELDDLNKDFEKIHIELCTWFQKKGLNPKDMLGFLMSQFIYIFVSFNLDEEEFKKISEYMLSIIKKEKLNEVNNQRKTNHRDND